MSNKPIYVEATPEQKKLGASHMRTSDGVLVSRQGFPIWRGDLAPSTASTVAVNKEENPLWKVYAR